MDCGAGRRGGDLTEKVSPVLRYRSWRAGERAREADSRYEVYTKPSGGHRCDMVIYKILYDKVICGMVLDDKVVYKLIRYGKMW